MVVCIDVTSVMCSPCFCRQQQLFNVLHNYYNFVKNFDCQAEGNLCVICIGTSDMAVYEKTESGSARPVVSVNEFAFNLEFIVKTAKENGCDVVIIAPPPVDRECFMKHVADGT